MLRKLLFTSTLSLCLLAVVAQPAGRFMSNKKGSLIGLHFNMADFKTPSVIKSTSLGDALKGDSWKKLSNYGYGFSASYWKGITSKIDFTLRGNVMFYDYSSIIYSRPGKTEAGFELEPSVSIRPFSDDHLFNPFLTAGLGAGIYTGNIGLYAPIGVGVQLNFNSVTYLFLQSQYHATITSKAPGSNLFYSIGFAENLTEPKQPPVVVAPPLPVVENKDRDNDGVENDKDACPDEAGLAALNGCPDKDKDGIADKADKCPDVAGSAQYNGCPAPDTDGDGIKDDVDQCPEKPGIARYNGCPVPDTDGDGLNDENDKCVSEPGPLSNEGCPDKKVEKAVNLAAKNIFFATGSARIEARSNAALNTIVKILKENPDYTASIEGHTDNTGNPDRNKALSEARARAVAAYLKAKGIEESRLTAIGYGQEVEIASNETAAGRAQNRRVEIKVGN